MERGSPQLPGVQIVRSGTATGDERIEQLRQAGHNTAWYDRGASSRLAAPMEAPATCSWFTLYLLEGDYAWTKTQAGEKYAQFRKLKATVAEPTWYCSCCNMRWATYAEAVSHVEVKA